MSPSQPGPQGPDNAQAGARETSPTRCTCPIPRPRGEWHADGCPLQDAGAERLTHANAREWWGTLQNHLADAARALRWSGAAGDQLDGLMGDVFASAHAACGIILDSFEAVPGAKGKG